jgi:hypothetical protein
MKRAIPLALLLASAGAAYWYTSRPATSLVLTGIVTTNHIVVSPQISPGAWTSCSSPRAIR